VQSVIEDSLRGLGYSLVDLEWHAGGQLRVFIEHAEGSQQDSGHGPGLVPLSEGPIPEDGSGIRIEDCERVSHQLSHVLTVENIDYARLEVSSPGLDRALRSRHDFERFSGFEITLKLKYAVAGRRNFEGLLMAGEDGRFVLEVVKQPTASKAGATAKVKSSGKDRGKSDRKNTDSGGQANDDAPLPLRLSFALDEIERARLVPKFKF
jgi:ribosome maturation factor RimP